MPDQNLSKQDLERIATEARIDIIQMIERAQSGHPGGSFSVIDLIVALFFTEMKWDPKNPAWEDRDRFILSKGHGGARALRDAGENRRDSRRKS